MKNSFYHRNCISIRDYSKEDILYILKEAEYFFKNPMEKVLNGKILASCFFESSTRTRLSFESAMLRLGGQTLGFSQSKGSATDKGESLSDSIKVISAYADLIVLRHPMEGAASLAAEVSDVPIINAGDGTNQHPTQTLVDLFTIKQNLGQLENLSYAFVGDLKYGRTVHSLVEALALFKSRFYFVSPKSLQIPKKTSEMLKQKGIMFSYHDNIEEVLPRVDILYMTRLQKERFEENANLNVEKSMCINAELLKKAKPGLKVLHPLPRNDEISKDVDKTDHARYFEQARNGVCVRQAILSLTLSNTKRYSEKEEFANV
jgi:aspartate carbamoyltransferase catalytic subunit